MPSPLTVSETFPSVDGLGKDYYSAKIISPAYASSTGELNSILQYTYHSFCFEGCGHKKIARELDGIAIAEMCHFKLLGRTLMALGAQPVFAQNPPAAFNFYSAKFVSYSGNLRCMIEDDIRSEKQAVCLYGKMLAKLRNEGVKAVIERILQDENLHLEKLEEILKGMKG